MPAQTMIVLGISDPAAPVISAVAGFIETVCFVPAQALVVLGIGDAPASIVTATPRLIETV